MAKKYCRAYYLKELRQFSGWMEKRKANEPELTDNDIVYLWDDFVVVKSPIISNTEVLFDGIIPAWQEFCKATLHFEIPEDLRYAYIQEEEQNKVEM